jgi:hypothetical protein
MAEHDEVSTGELYRLCLRIEAKVDKTNGRVDRCEDEIDTLKQHMSAVKAYWSAGVFVLALAGDWVKHKIGL